MKRRPSWGRWLVLLGVSGLWLAGAGCGSGGLVGGDCAAGYEFCDGRCVELATDPEHCGSCGNRCLEGQSCVQGECASGGPGGSTGAGGSGGSTSGGTGGAGTGGAGTGGWGEGGLGGASSGGASTGGSTGSGGVTGTGGAGTGGAGTGGAGTGGAGTGGSGTGGSGTGGAGTGGSGTGGGGSCLPPYDTPSACGDCDTQCVSPTPLCAPSGGGHVCVPSCTIPPETTNCGGSCVDVQTDADHCGGCFRPCPSGICVAGSCIGATPGHMVALCMNYEQYSASAAQTVLLGNSVFLSNQEPVRVLAYGQYTSSSLRATTLAALNAAAASRGRSYQLTEAASAAEVATELDRTNFDVLLVYDQNLATLGQLTAVGSSWASVTQGFAEDGGVVIVLTGGGTSVSYELVRTLGISNVTGTTARAGERFYVQAPGDALAINVVSPFLGIQRSCTFTTSDTSSGERVFVITDTPVSGGVGAPGAIHRIVQDGAP